MPESQVTPDPKLEKRTRRIFKPEYKLRIIQEADACKHGDLGALLRREKLYLSLYAITDLFSRYTVAWMISLKENSALAMQLMDEASVRCRIEPGQLTLHQDRGSPMTANGFLGTMRALDITCSIAVLGSAMTMHSAKVASRH